MMSGDEVFLPERSQFDIRSIAILDLCDPRRTYPQERMHFEQHSSNETTRKKSQRDVIILTKSNRKAALTPLNISIVLVLLTLLFLRSRRADNEIDLPSQTATIFRTFTPRTLLPFNGNPSKPLNPDGKVYLAVKGKVYDVTSGRNFYGPGGPYENFAGRDATRGLACQSFDEEMLTKNLDGPLDDCKDLGREELENLQGWVERFEEKYLVVGKLTAFGNLATDYSG